MLHNRSHFDCKITNFFRNSQKFAEIICKFKQFMARIQVVKFALMDLCMRLHRRRLEALLWLDQ